MVAQKPKGESGQLHHSSNIMGLCEATSQPCPGPQRNALSPLWLPGHCSQGVHAPRRRLTPHTGRPHAARAPPGRSQPPEGRGGASSSALNPRALSECSVSRLQKMKVTLKSAFSGEGIFCDSSQRGLASDDSSLRSHVLHRFIINYMVIGHHTLVLLA